MFQSPALQSDAVEYSPDLFALTLCIVLSKNKLF